MRIALTGNPNSGKTTMYNALTGRNEKVGNWAGVTVDKKEAPIKKIYAGEQELVAVDLPGAYSMSPFTSEESITSDYVANETPDVIINIVDATNLSHSLFFTTQLLELGIPMVVALNKSDVNEKKETKLNTIKTVNIDITNIDEDTKSRLRGAIKFFTGDINGHDVVLVKSGIGKVSAGIVTLLMIEHFKPELIINSGIAGGYNHQLKPLDIVIGNKVGCYDIDMRMDGTAYGAFSNEDRIIQLNEKILNKFC